MDEGAESRNKTLLCQYPSYLLGLYSGLKHIIVNDIMIHLASFCIPWGLARGTERLLSLERSTITRVGNGIHIR